MFNWNLQGNRTKRKPKFNLGDLFWSANIEKVFGKGERGITNWSYKLYTITGTIHETIPSCQIQIHPKDTNKVFYDEQDQL